jgi:hypothetical protein
MTYNVREFFRDDIQHESPDHVEIWRGWFAQLGVGPDEVLLTEWVERRPPERKVVFLEDGVRDGEPITVERVVQLPLGVEVPEFPIP